MYFSSYRAKTVLFLQVLSEMSYKQVLKPLNKPAF